MLNENELGQIEHRRNGASFNPLFVSTETLRKDFDVVLGDLHSARALIAVAIRWRDEVVSDRELALAIDQFRESEFDVESSDVMHDDA